MSKVSKMFRVVSAPKLPKSRILLP